MHDRRSVHSPPHRTVTLLIAKKMRRPSESEFGMSANKKRLAGSSRSRGEFPRDHRTRGRFQGLSKILFVLDKNQLVLLGRYNARHGPYLNTPVAAQPRLHSVSNLLQRVLHASHCIAAATTEGSASATTPAIPPLFLVIAVMTAATTRETTTRGTTT